MTKRYNTFELHHLASFIEGDHILKPDDVVRHVNQLQKAKRIDETPCEVKLDEKGVRVKIKDTKETVEFFQWDSIKDQAAILNYFENFKYKYLVLFRCLQYNYELKRRETELHVFSCETTSIAKSLVDSMSYHKRDYSDSKTPAKFDAHMRRGKSEEKINVLSSSYGRDYYMLNKCIDDIENYERRLEKCIKCRSAGFRSVPGDDLSECHYTLSSSETVEIVRKLKFAINTNEKIRFNTPERTSKQLFVRLFNTVQWLDDICQRNYLPQFDSNLVRDTIEPLFSEVTISSIMERLPPKKQNFWKQLGPAWNISAEKWPQTINRYSPRFDDGETNSRRSIDHSLNEDRPASCSSPSRITHSVSVNNLSRSSPIRTIEKIPEPKLDRFKMREFCERLSEQGGKLYLVKVHHVSAKPQELSVQAGDIVEVLENSRGSWWSVKSCSGEIGQVPGWKLKQYVYKPTDIKSNKSSPRSSPTFPRSTHHHHHANNNINGMNTVNNHTISLTNNNNNTINHINDNHVVNDELNEANNGSCNGDRIIQIKHDDLIESSGTEFKHINLSDQHGNCTNNLNNHPNNNNTNNNNNIITNNNSSGNSNITNNAAKNTINNHNNSCFSNHNNHNNKNADVDSQSWPQSTTAQSETVNNSNYVCMTPAQLQEAIKNNPNLPNIPMILVPVSNFCNNQAGSLNGMNNNMYGSTRTLNNKKSDFNSNSLPFRNQTPPPFGWKPNQIISGTTATHMHTMTRELRERLSKMKHGGGSGLKSVPTPSNSIDRLENRLSKYATKEEVAEWLVAHKFSPKAIAALRGFNGMDLYTMNRAQLEQHIGSERCDELFYAFRGC